MKYLITIFITLFSSTCYAQQGIQNVHEVALSTNSITQTLALCASSGGSCSGSCDVAQNTSSGTLSGSFAIEVYNPSASTSTINCGFDPMVSTAATSVWYGREVTAGSGVYWAKQSGRKLYCMTQNSSGCTYATITQMK